MIFTEREKAIRKEKEYAERRFTQLLAQIDKIDPDAIEEQIETTLIALDEKWRDFCKNLIYLKAGGEDEFMKVAQERAYPKITIAE